MNIDDVLDELEEVDGFWLGKRSECDIVTAETALGVRFPPEYRRFVSGYGCGNVGAYEIYGVIDAERTGVPSCVDATLDARRAGTATENDIVVYALGNGDLGVLDQATGTVSWVTSVGGREPASPSFAAFLSGRVELARS